MLGACAGLPGCYTERIGAWVDEKAEEINSWRLIVSHLKLFVAGKLGDSSHLQDDFEANLGTNEAELVRKWTGLWGLATPIHSTSHSTSSGPSSGPGSGWALTHRRGSDSQSAHPFGTRPGVWGWASAVEGTGTAGCSWMENSTDVRANQEGRADLEETSYRAGCELSRNTMFARLKVINDELPSRKSFDYRARGGDGDGADWIRQGCMSRPTLSSNWTVSTGRARAVEDTARTWAAPEATMPALVGPHAARPWATALSITA